MGGLFTPAGWGVYVSTKHALEGHMDPQEMIDRMIDIVPADNGKFRNVVPKAADPAAHVNLNLDLVVGHIEVRQS